MKGINMKINWKRKIDEYMLLNAKNSKMLNTCQKKKVVEQG